MSERSGYSDDGEFLHLYRGTVDRSLAGKRGQRFLKRLLDALERLPKKELIQDTLKDKETGAVCALGACGERMGLDMSMFRSDDHSLLGRIFDVPACLVAEVEYLNDERPSSYGPEADQKRWQNMVTWCKEHLRNE